MLKKYFLITFIFSFFLALSAIYAESENAQEQTEQVNNMDEITAEIESGLGLALDIDLDDDALNNLTVEDLDKAEKNPSVMEWLRIYQAGAKYHLSEAFEKHPKKMYAGTGVLTCATAAALSYLIWRYLIKKNNPVPVPKN